MDWVTCVKCGFTQIPTEKCLRCSRPFDGPPSSLAPRPAPLSSGAEPEARTVALVIPPEALAAVPPPEPSDSLAATVPFAPAAPVDPVDSAAGRPPAGRRVFAPHPPAHSSARARPRGRSPALAIAGVAVLALAVAAIALRRHAAGPAVQAQPASSPAPAPAALDLSGLWETEFSKTLRGNPPRPAFKQVSIDTDRDGAILSASVLLTDPGRGGAGAGYRLVQDGPDRLRRTAAALAVSPGGAVLPIEFVPFPAWMPARERVWRVLEGLNRKSTDVRYLLLESVEDDYLVQAGINRSGFLSYAFFSKEYAHNRGVDALSAIIHPEPGSDLRGFRNLVWDLSGAADFLTLEVTATLSGPEGTMDRLVMKRKAGGLAAGRR